MATTEQYKDGGAASYTFSIEYIKAEDIKVSVDGTDLTYTATNPPAQTTEYTVNGSNVIFKQASVSGSTTGGVRIYRVTGLEAADSATFVAGSSIRASDLNANHRLVRFSAQEKNQKVVTDDIKDSQITSAKIKDGTIVNADISSTAEIEVSKLRQGSARQLLQTAANGTDVEFTSNVDIPGTLDVTGNADIDSNLNVDGTLTVASAVDFNNDLDVDGNTNLDNTTIDGYINVSGVATVDNVRIDGNEVRAHSGNLELDSQGGTVTVDDNLNVTGNLTCSGTFNNLTTTEVAILDGATLSTQELNTLDGITASTSELNKLDGVTSSTAEINKLTGVTATSSEINRLAGLTSSTDELNKLDGVTATTAEINKLDGLTSSTNELNILDGVTANKDEINKLDGVTATTAELNLNDGQTATAADVNILDGATLTTAELNKLDGYTGSTADLNEVVAGKNVVETISSTATDAQIPTAQAVNERITTVVSDVGGFVPIANETSFPTDNPDLDNAAGTIVSIKALSSTFTTGSGVTTHTFTDGAGSGNNVTITGLTASTTYPAGRGMLLETTPTSGNGSANPPRAYAFHRLTLDEAGVANAQAVVDDFDERYYGPLGSEPNTRPGGGARVQGDLYFSTVDNQMKVWNNAASQWDDVASSASSNIITLSPAFNGSETEFTCSTVPVDAQSLLLSINGVIQKPNSGTSTPSEGYVKLANGKIKLASAPATGAPYFAVALGNTVSIGTPSPDTVGATELKDGEIANVHISNTAGILKSKIETFVNNNADNRVITGSGTANTLNGEADFTYDGDNCIISRAGNSVAGLTVRNTNNSQANAVSQISIEGGDNSYAALQLETNNQSHKIYQLNTGEFGLEKSGVTRFLINGSGNVGIGLSGSGTEGIDRKLHVKSAGLIAKLESTSSNSLIMFATPTNEAANKVPNIGANDNNLEFTTGNLTRLTISDTGKVGIGTTSPAYPLHVVDSYHFTVAGGNSTTGMKIGNYDGSSYGKLTTRGSELRFDIGDTNKMILSASGDLQLRNAETSHQAIQFYRNNSIGCSFSYGENNANPTLNIYRSDSQSGYPYGNLIINTGHGTNPTQALKLRTDKNIELAGNLIMASGKGIDFSATGNSSGTTQSELFDDYEEGTWTPVLQGSSTSFTTNPGYAVRNANYTRIGRQVHCDCYISWNTSGAGAAGHVRLYGLPFTEGGHGTYPGVCYGFYDIASSLLNENEDLLGYVQNLANYVVLYKGNNAGGSNILNVATMCNNQSGNFQMSFTYMT